MPSSNITATNSTHMTCSLISKMIHTGMEPMVSMRDHTCLEHTISSHIPTLSLLPLSQLLHLDNLSSTVDITTPSLLQPWLDRDH